MKTRKRILSVAMAAIMTATTALAAAVPAAAAETGSAPFSWDNASVYFLLTDRFNNGDTSNDYSYNRLTNPDKTTARDEVVSDAASFQGGDFKGITEKINAGYFNDLGINALWISAPYEQTHGYSVATDNVPSYPHYAYHGYYVLDYTQTDANFGTKEEFGALVEAAHEKGLRVVMDVVMNHSGYNSLYDMNEFGFGTIKETANGTWDDAYYSWGNITQKGGKYDYHQFIDYDSKTEDNIAAWAKWWGKDWVRAGIADYTSGGSDNLTMSLDYLPDFKTESTAAVDIPELLKTKWTGEGVLSERQAELDAWFTKTGNAKTVRNYQVFWLSQWVREYGIDGFRCDTAKHVDLESWKALKDECLSALDEWKTANPDKAIDDEDFWMVGENWDSKQTLSYNDYFTKAGFDSMINFEFGGGKSSGQTKGLPAIGSLNETYKKYSATINETEYNTNFNMLTYISSHDDGLYRKSDLAYQASALMLMPGGVQVYYGDESNRPVVEKKTGVTLGDHAYRSFMNWETTDTALLSHWQKLGQFRNTHIAVGGGIHRTLTTTSGLAFTRMYLDGGKVTDTAAACITDELNKDVTITVGPAFKEGTTVTNTYDGKTQEVKDGKVTFNSGAYGTILLEGESTGVLPGEGIYGDADLNGKVELEDALLVSKHTAKLITLGGDAFDCADVSLDGEVGVEDLLRIQQHLALLPASPVGEPR